jgi:hypothetical protein
VRMRFVPVCQLALRSASTVVGQTARPRRRGADGRRTAATLSIYETRNGRAATASQLLGAGVDLSCQDGPAKTTAA